MSAAFYAEYNALQQLEKKEGCLGLSRKEKQLEDWLRKELDLTP